MISKQKHEYSIIFGSKSTKNKFTELLGQIKITSEEAKIDTDIFKLLSSLKFNASYLFIEMKFLLENCLDDKIVRYMNENKEKYLKLPFILIKDESEIELDYINKLHSGCSWLFIKVIDKKINKQSLDDFIKNIKIDQSMMQNAKGEDNKEVPVNSKSNLSKYKFIAQLGKGQEGVVNLVENKLTKKIIALKTIELQKMDEKDKTKLRERTEQFGIIECPTIIQIYETFEEGPNFYIAMEYAVGGMLSDFIQSIKISGDSVSSDTLKSWTVELLVSLKFLSIKNITHRDIKPDNIILCEHPKLKSKVKTDMVLKLIDFGSAKVITNIDGNTTIGTLFYMAPEVISNLQYDNQIDLWSFGVVLYELLAKERPFPSLDNDKLRSEIKFSNPIPYLKNKDERFKYIVERILRKNPSRRITLNEILSMEFLEEEITKLSSDIEEFDKFDVIHQIKNFEHLLCPYQSNIIIEKYLDKINFCMKIIDNVIRKSYQKSYLSAKVSCYQGFELIEYALEVYSRDDLVTSIFSFLLENKMIYCISKDDKSEIIDKEYYQISLDSFEHDIDNPLFGSFDPLTKNRNHLKLTEFILHKGILIINDLYKEIKDNEEQDNLSLSDNELLTQFLYGISLFQDYKLMDINKKSKDEKHAFLLNLYQIMFIHSLLKEKLNFKSKKNFLSSMIKNDIAINYKFKDYQINNLELRFGIFRKNAKPLENYLKICSNNDERLNLCQGLDFKFTDMLVTPHFWPSNDFDMNKYLFYVFDDKNMVFQLHQYVINFIDKKILDVTDESKWIISILYEKYYDFDFKKEQGFFRGINESIKYAYRFNDDEAIYKLENIAKEHEQFKNLSCILKNIMNGTLAIEFS